MKINDLNKIQKDFMHGRKSDEKDAASFFYKIALH